MRLAGEPGTSGRDAVPNRSVDDFVADPYRQATDERRVYVDLDVNVPAVKPLKRGLQPADPFAIQRGRTVDDG
jgi:hypothetical protein